MLENSSIHSYKQLNIRVYQSIVLEMRDCIVTLKRQNLATFASGKLVKEENYEKAAEIRDKMKKGKKGREEKP